MRLWLPNRPDPADKPLILPSKELTKPKTPDGWNSGPILVTPKAAKIVVSPGEIDSVSRWRQLHDWEDKLIREAEKLARMFDKYRHPLLAGAAAGAWTLTNNTRTYMLNGTFDWDTDTFKIALFLSTSNLSATTTTFAGATNEVGTTNTGYAAGGVATTISLSGTTSVAIQFTQAQWTAGSANLTARWGAVYEVAGNIGAYFLCDSTPADVTATNGNTFTISAGNVMTVA